MEAYTSFARVYDTFMDNVPYKEWADYLGKILKEYGIAVSYTHLDVYKRQRLRIRDGKKIGDGVFLETMSLS